MSGKLLYGWTACLVASLGLGCSAGSQTVRGQNPDATAFGPGSSVEWAGSPSTRPSGPASYAAGTMGPGAAVCPHGIAGGCRLDGATGAGNGWAPTHSHWFDYERPRGLVYPPANQPAGVVMYPYYTVKGPTDFFLE